MLRIRADQLKAFEEDRLHQWLAEDLRGLYPERAGPVEPQAMRATVAIAVQRWSRFMLASCRACPSIV